MKHRPLVFLDVETTGASARSSRITEIGALRVEDHKVVATFKQLINPEENVPPFITRLTGITNEMLWDAPTFRSIADELELFLSDAIFIAHNAPFDYSFIQAEFANIKYRFHADRLCSARLSRRLYPDLKGHSLDKVIERLGVNVQSRHRAYDDAEVIYKFYQNERQRDEVQLFSAMNKLLVKTRMPLS